MTLSVAELGQAYLDVAWVNLLEEMQDNYILPASCMVLRLSARLGRLKIMNCYGRWPEVIAAVRDIII